MDAPFPYFGGKSSVAHIVWQALGDVKHYIEPFAGSLAVLLNRPNVSPSNMETINDADGHITNIWRSLQKAPDEVAKVCDFPVSHIELNARRAALRNESQELVKRLQDVEYYDARLAGFYIWCAGCWIGAGLTQKDGGPYLGHTGRGVHKLGKRPHLTNTGKDVRDPYNLYIYTWFRELSERLRRVRTFCGDWTRVCNGDWQDGCGIVGFFFDPPYSDKANRCENLYTVDSLSVAHDVREWCIARGGRKSYRIVLAGYYEEHEELLSHGWSVYRYKVNGGYGNKNKNGYMNKYRETLFMSPYCLLTEKQAQQQLFNMETLNNV